MKDNSFFSNDPKILSKNSHDCPVLCKWVFDISLLAEELFSNALWSLETCVLVNNNLCGIFALLI